ncbi:MAG TPA: CaiB/BaiF CoA-transferase family protein [Vicinamibacteria bacterium]
MTPTPTPGALVGLKVLDLTRYIPGPYCTLLLGDLGADVVKVEEPPLGDPTRLMPPQGGEQGAVFESLNRNKRSLLVDLRSDGGREVVRRLAERADVMVEGFRPGVLERRGLGAEAVCAANPRLVYCSLTGWGSEGPLAPRAGHDITYLARAGLLAVTRDEAGDPVVPGTPVADMSGAQVAFGAILAALYTRERTGRGQVVQASLFGAALGLMTAPIERTAAGGGGLTELSGAYPGYRVYRCRDGRHLAVGALEPKFWEKLCRALGVEDLIGRQWAEGEERREAVGVMADVFAARDRDDWVEALAAADVCVEPVLEPDEAAAQEQARQVLGGPPFRLLHTPAVARRAAPGLGAHTDAVLDEIGYAGAERRALREAGAVA